MNRSIPGLPVHYKLLEFTQTHAHRVGDAIQPSHLLSSPSPPAPNPSQHQGLFQNLGHWQYLHTSLTTKLVGLPHPCFRHYVMKHMILDTVFPRTSLPETKSLIENLFCFWLLLRFWPNFFEELRRKTDWLFQEMKNSPNNKMSSPGKKKTVTLSSPGGPGGNQAAWNICRFEPTITTNYQIF